MANGQRILLVSVARQYQIGGQHGKHRPQRIRSRFLAIPEHEWADGGEKCCPQWCTCRDNSSSRQPVGKYPYDRHQQCGRHNRHIAQHEFFLACQTDQYALQQKRKEWVLVDRRHGIDAVRDPEHSAYQIKPALFGALKAEAFIPPKCLGIQQQGNARIGQEDQTQQQHPTPQAREVRGRGQRHRVGLLVWRWLCRRHPYVCHMQVPNARLSVRLARHLVRPPSRRQHRCLARRGAKSTDMFLAPSPVTRAIPAGQLPVVQQSRHWSGQTSFGGRSRPSPPLRRPRCGGAS